jgi:hypothetical protein
METESLTLNSSNVTRAQILELIETLPMERLQSVYDFVLFLKTRPLAYLEEDIFGESEEEIQADEAKWEAQFAVNRDKLRALAEEATAEYRAGKTKPMEFTREGRLKR